MLHLNLNIKNLILKIWSNIFSALVLKPSSPFDFMHSLLHNLIFYVSPGSGLKTIPCPAKKCLPIRSVTFFPAPIFKVEISVT